MSYLFVSDDYLSSSTQRVSAYEAYDRGQRRRRQLSPLLCALLTATSNFRPLAHTAFQRAIGFLLSASFRYTLDLDGQLSISRARSPILFPFFLIRYFTMRGHSIPVFSQTSDRSHSSLTGSIKAKVSRQHTRPTSCMTTGPYIRSEAQLARLLSTASLPVLFYLILTVVHLIITLALQIAVLRSAVFSS